MKRFLAWIGLKAKLHETEHKPPLVSEGDIWWASVGENVGSEVDGKGDAFTRPIIIYKKLGSESLLAIPTSTKQKEGTWYVGFQHKGINEIALLSQIRVISFRRLKERIGTLSNSEMEDIRKGFRNLYH